MPATAVGRLSEHRADSEHSNRTAVEHRAESVELRAGENATAIDQSQTGEISAAPRSLELCGVVARIGLPREAFVPEIEAGVENLLEGGAIGVNEFDHLVNLTK